ncbi:MAG TPA: hypothetical protein VH475_23005, partial [Tepidisphaeraceae bacterium]
MFGFVSRLLRKLGAWFKGSTTPAAAVSPAVSAPPIRRVIEEMEPRRMLSGNGLAATYFDN